MTGTRFRTSLLIGLCCLAIYNANGRSIAAGDTYPSRYLPFAIVQDRTVFLNPVANVAAQGRGAGAFWMLTLPDGRLMSLYPVVQPLLLAPLYVPAVAYLHLRGWTPVRLDWVARVMEKLSASLLAALSVALLYLLLRRRTTPRDALLLTIAYAFGTTTWVVSSQALWQHGIAQLMIVLVLLLLTGPATAPRAALVALLCGLIACNRPPDVILAAALGLYAILWAGWRRTPLLAAMAALPMVLVLSYNLRYGQNIAGGYGLIGKSTFFFHPLLPGVAGILVSPAKGLLIYSPFLLFLVLAWRYRPRTTDEQRLTLLMAAAVVVQILLYAKTDWRSGLSWGPRYMTDLLPFLIWMLVPIVERLRGAARGAFIATTAVAIAIEAIGAFCYAGWQDTGLYVIGGPHKMLPAWQWRNASILTALRHGLATPDLFTETRGSFDAIEPVGKEVFAAGWALAGHRSAPQVAVIIDGQNGVPANTFIDRPDVRATLHESAAAGWRIPIDTSHLTPGEHHLTAMVWASAEGDGRYLGERTLLIPAPADDDLPSAHANALTHLRNDQQPPGYWLTAYTTGLRYRKPGAEMNTFLTSLLVDLLDPIAASEGLHENLARARAHLTDQIEPGGLVRYHGRPDAPWIGSLGCVITPDTDDTALVWRIAPAHDRRRLASALATIRRYRTADGLYRSWLAGRDQFQCLDPGRDSNPTDIAIQLHLLLLLAQTRPAEAHALCEALRPRLDDDRVWVYYRRTPLVPMLRLPELRRAGCALELPASRTLARVPGQAIWLTAIRLLDGSDPALGHATLRELAKNDFALLRTNPPLVYHNDLTATVSRYYWSEDLGYALWLRLYDIYEHGSGNHR